MGCFNCKVVILLAWFTSVLEANCMFVVSSSFPNSGVKKGGGTDKKATSLSVVKTTNLLFFFFTVTIFYEATSIAPIETNG